MDDKAREELVERVARTIWSAYTNSNVPPPDLHGISWDELNRWAASRPRLLEIINLARDEARAALAVMEPVVREECAKVADAHFQKAHGMAIAAAIRGGSNGG